VQAELLRVVPPPPQERLYAIRHGVYCQFNGEGEPPAMLAGYLRNNGGRLPPYIPLPTRHVIFILGNGFVGERRVKWTGTGTLPEAVMAFVIENGTLPRHELSTASGS
jgi:hypothetical protein